jgi:nudix-type nucleoside diphosphatase (YffH/AdpP family)
MDAEILGSTVAYSGWNRMLVATVRTASGAEIKRSVEDHGAAVALLPFDPRRRCALLVRQLRVPVLMAEGAPTLLEAPAGILDSDDPAACARREAMEEAGLELADLVALGKVYPMPGISTERIHLFLAEYDVASRVAEGGGLAEENEEIEIVEMDLSELAALADAGSLNDLKTFALVQALRLRRPDLFR